MFFYIKQLLLFILVFISFHFTYNYVKGFFTDKKKETDVSEPTKYTNVLKEINDLLEKNTKNPTEELNTQSDCSSLNNEGIAYAVRSGDDQIFRNKMEENDETKSIQSSIIKSHSLEEQLTDYMKEIEKEVLTQENTEIPVNI